VNKNLCMSVELDAFNLKLHVTVFPLRLANLVLYGLGNLMHASISHFSLQILVTL
jgi:hypothetical protein